MSLISSLAALIYELKTILMVSAVFANYRFHGEERQKESSQHAKIPINKVEINDARKKIYLDVQV